MPSASSRPAELRSTRIASRVRSDTLRAPISEQSCLRAEYSSSESRTLIMRERGFRTAMLDSEKAGDYWLLSSCAANWRLTRGIWQYIDSLAADRDLGSSFGIEFWAGFAPICPRQV